MHSPEHPHSFLTPVTTENMSPRDMAEDASASFGDKSIPINSRTDFLEVVIIVSGPEWKKKQLRIVSLNAKNKRNDISSCKK